MSNFSERVTFNVGPEALKRAIEMALDELDLSTAGSVDAMIFREKLRFDAYNPVTVEITLEERGGATELRLAGENDGIGPFQEHHVRNKVMELLSRIQLDLESIEDRAPVNDTGEFSMELQMLTRLHEKGIITDLEYQKARENLLHHLL
jgi:hypothetical protein